MVIKCLNRPILIPIDSSAVVAENDLFALVIEAKVDSTTVRTLRRRTVAFGHLPSEDYICADAPETVIADQFMGILA